MQRFMTCAMMLCCAASIANATEFESPRRLTAGTKSDFIQVEVPGYAAPCWFDVDGDGKKDLVVGQFSSGKMKFYKNLGNATFAEGSWMKADGKVAEVPGVW